MRVRKQLSLKVKYQLYPPDGGEGVGSVVGDGDGVVVEGSQTHSVQITLYRVSILQPLMSHGGLQVGGSPMKTSQCARNPRCTSHTLSGHHISAIISRA